MGFQEFTEVKSAVAIRNAGVIPLKGKDLKELTTVKLVPTISVLHLLIQQLV